MTALTVGTAAAMPTNRVETQAPRQTRPDPSTDSSPRTPSPGFLLDKGRFTTFDVSDARVGTSPLGINDRGQIVGFTISDPAAGVLHGFLLAKGVKGRFTPVEVPGAPSTSAGGINDRGQIVGSYSDPAAGGRPPAL